MSLKNVELGSDGCMPGIKFEWHRSGYIMIYIYMYKRGMVLYIGFAIVDQVV